jgi:hypothetical protein
MLRTAAQHIQLAIGIENRAHPRYGVRLSVKYSNAAEFVADYVENLSAGGLFIANAHRHENLYETEVDVELPGQGSWRVKARAVYRLDAEVARRQGRRPGVGFQIIERPAGFDDALLGYLLRLGKRRDFTVMAGDIVGRQLLVDTGYQVVPLAVDIDLARALEDPKLLAIVVPPDIADPYRGYGGGERVVAIGDPDQIADLIARLDSMLE